MKITITKDQHTAFLKALKKAESVTRARTTLPILDAVLITAEGNEVRLQSSNLDQSFDIRVEAGVLTDGRCGVNASDLLRVASLSADMTMEVDDKRMTIQGAGTFKLPLFPVADFPPFPAIDSGDKIKITTAEIQRLLNVGYAMSTDSGRYVLQGICFNAAAKQSSACNGGSLALSTAKPAKDGWKPIVPDVACRILGTLLDGGGEYEAGFGDSSASFENEGTVFFTRLIEGSYPNFHVVLREPEFSVTVNRKALIEALARACVAVNDSERIQMTLSNSTASLEVQGKNADSFVTLDLLTPLKGRKEFTISFNSSFLSDAAKAMSDDDISLEFIDDLSPLCVRGDAYAVIAIMRNK